jgi:NDP-sugar pyrophosphorylase family protein
MDKDLVGLILAAGRSERFSCFGRDKPKVLFKVGGRRLLLRNIELMRDQLNIKYIYIVVGYGKESIINLCGKGDKLGVSINYIVNNNLSKGLAYGLFLFKEYVNKPFCVLLGDEFYYRSNHSKLVDFLEDNFLGVCGVKKQAEERLIKKNYSVEIKNNRIDALSEKPPIVKNDYLGCGTFLFSPKIFFYIEKALKLKIAKKIEIADVLNLAAQEGEIIYPFFIKGEYVNVNNPGDLNSAKQIVRDRKHQSSKVSLIIPSDNEAEAIGTVLDDFKDKVDEIIVADNNSLDNTVSIAKDQGACVFTNNYSGYGAALKFAAQKASGDILVFVEADGSFRSYDLGKILKCLKNYDMAIGTRTAKAAGMNIFLRYGNILMARLVKFLWKKHFPPQLSDVGCTYRGIWKSSYLEIFSDLKTDGPEFSLEMMIESIKNSFKIREIPVSYFERQGGVSKHSKNLFGVIKTAMRMLRVIGLKKIKLFR